MYSLLVLCDFPLIIDKDNYGYIKKGNAKNGWYFYCRNCQKTKCPGSLFIEFNDSLDFNSLKVITYRDNDHTDIDHFDKKRIELLLGKKSRLLTLKMI